MDTHHRLEGNALLEVVGVDWATGRDVLHDAHAERLHDGNHVRRMNRDGFSDRDGLGLGLGLVGRHPHYKVHRPSDIPGFDRKHTRTSGGAGSGRLDGLAEHGGALQRISRRKEGSGRGGTDAKSEPGDPHGHGLHVEGGCEE